MWDKKSPIIDNHELVMLDDLTDNDLVIRAINCSSILRNIDLLGRMDFDTHPCGTASTKGSLE